MSSAAVKEAMHRLLIKSVIRGDQLENLLQDAVNVAYWRSLNPDLVISPLETAARVEDFCILPEQQVQALDHLTAHGYFALPPVYPPQLIARMRSCVDVVRNAGWPAVFTYLYDQFWAVFQSKGMVGFIRKYLGDYRINANIWTYYVHPNPTGSGWTPHVDGRSDIGRLTVWIPLTDASVVNGCIYVLPQDRVPGTLPRNYQDWRTLDIGELSSLLHSVRPLPANAGSILGWNHELIHWGGRASDLATDPRISIAVEFISEQITPMKSELPVSSPGVAPDFPSRLKLIAKAILEYQKFEPLMTRYGLLAQRLIGVSKTPG